MLKRLHLRNFTVFADAEFDFGDGLNVLVGTNGTGKTHVLKAGYSMLSSTLLSINNNIGYTIEQQRYVRTLETGVQKLKRVFQTTFSSLTELIKYGLEEAELNADLSHPNGNVNVHTVLKLNHQKSIAPVSIDREESTRGIKNPVFIPAKEALTLGWLPPLYGRFDIPFDETYLDVLKLLFGPSLRQP